MILRTSDPRNLEATIKICRILKESGGRCLVVGGAVRDALLGKASEELDLECFGLEDKSIRQVLEPYFELGYYGKSFGVWKILNYKLDLALPREEDKIGHAHTDFRIRTDPFLSPERACLRRDFTINAILYDPLTDEIIDPLNGVKDINQRIIRHCSDKFSEDALRVLRAMRFSAVLDFDVHPSTIQICSQLTLEHLSAERVHEEWKKMMLTATKFSKALNFLRETKHLDDFPELAALVGCAQNPKYHPEGDVFTHTSLCMDRFCELRPSNEDEALKLGFATLCHDLGKPATSSVNEYGNITSHGHEVVGVEIARTLMNRLTKKKELIEAVLPLVRWHMEERGIVAAKNKKKKIRKIVSLLDNPRLLSDLFVIDSNGRGQPKLKVPDGAMILREELESLEKQDQLDPPNWITGDFLISLGISPGPRLGRIIKISKRKQLEGFWPDAESARQDIKRRFKLASG